MKKNNAYCKGLLCYKSDRRYVSHYTKKRMCGICAIPIKVNGKTKYCTIDEYLNPNYAINWDKINKEFEEMINSLNLSKKTTIKFKEKVKQ